ncbi:hypothetical protein A3B93_02410 [Candidatus Nomurabacteria bacterium RIFCSPHIGHO2_02_FULL_42_24]|uniref:Enolase n=1 Tax=Candidatus Nomurabacteria bacterium RIFCSPHIGHO2_02_FULL_42_24 TaxID=1801757 RepID=A0A1F6WJH6_9BACT|nr:MAG: hypothetical protein A3B93_02410 [Candidatus Nomurabacteria bacterium RIFCSPHIGHO2_02_FULL_42_24]
MIDKIFAEEIKDSRGKSTIKVTVYSDDKSASFSVPSGASTGAHEAYVIENAKAIKNINEIIAPVLIGKNIENQKEIDEFLINLDGTKNKSKLGGNTIIGVSIAIVKTAAKVKGMEVFEYLRTLVEVKLLQRKTPYLYMNLINGGKHTHNNLAFQEYHVVPDTQNASEAVQIGITIQNSVKEIILGKYGKESLVLGDEGGYAPKITDIREPLVILSDVMEKNNLTGKVRLALDVAASSFYKDGNYIIGNKNVPKEELMSIYKNLINEFNLLSIEDPFNEEDFEGFANLKIQNPNLKVVGDDLTVTNVERLQMAIDKKSINAMIIKPNQIGTLSETLATMKLARENNIELIVSHRSGETDDDFIADLAYAFGCFGLKSGAPSKPERKVKYGRLIEISKK